MTSKASFSAKDHDGEKTSFGVYLPTINAGNIAAITAAVAGLVVTVNDIVLGEFDGLNLCITQTKPSNVPLNGFAQREAKWRVNYIDDVDGLGDGSFEIGMPDLGKLAAGTGKANLEDADIAAFVGALEGVAVSRLGNAITVTDIVHVGRNV